MELLNECVKLIIVVVGILITLSALVAIFTRGLKKDNEARNVKQRAMRRDIINNERMFKRKTELNLLGLLDSRRKSRNEGKDNGSSTTV